MIPCDWIGIVTIHSDTRLTRSTSGTMKITPSAIVLISGGEHDRRVLVDGDLGQRLQQVAQLQRERVGHHHIRRRGELTGGERLL